MKTLLACSALAFASFNLSAAVVTGGGTTTGTSTGTTTTTTTTVVTPKPSTGSCQKPVAQTAVKPVEVKCEKKQAPKPAPLKSAAPTCSKK